MTSREQFEAWAPNYCWKYSTTKELAWLAWQASRETVVVEPPELFEDDRHAVTDAIRAAGIKVKGE